MVSDPEDLAPFDEAYLDVVLKPRQVLFIQEYLIDCNASKAALRAGVGAQSGSQWLEHPVIAARIRQAIAQRITRTQITQDQVLHEMSLLANSRLDWFRIDDTGHVALTALAPEGAMAAVASINRKVKVTPGKGEDLPTTEYDVTIKLWDKPGPLKLMGRHVGLFPDKVEHTGAGGGPIETVTRIERRIVKPQEAPTSGPKETT